MADKKDTATKDTDLFEKMFLLGVGAFALTKEKVDAVVDDLVERGRLSQSDGKNLASEMRERGAEQREAMAAFVKEQTDKVLAGAHVATKADVDAVHRELAALRAELASEAAGAASRKR